MSYGVSPLVCHLLFICVYCEHRIVCIACPNWPMVCHHWCPTPSTWSLHILEPFLIFVIFATFCGKLYCWWKHFRNIKYNFLNFYIALKANDKQWQDMRWARSSQTTTGSSHRLSGKYENYVIGSNVNKDHETISPFHPFNCSYWSKNWNWWRSSNLTLLQHLLAF